MWRTLIVILFTTACGGIATEQIDPQRLDSTPAGTLDEPAGYCPQHPYPASPLPENAVATPVCQGLQETSGPVWDARLGKLFFSHYDVHAPAGFPGGIMEYEPTQGCSSFSPNTGSSGLALDAAGELLAALHETKTIGSVDPLSGARSNVITCYQGRGFNSTHDVSVSRGGSIYFTDPALDSASFPEALYARPIGQGLVPIVLDGRHPQGVALSLDERKLYVSVEAPAEILMFDVDEQGALAHQRPFAFDHGNGLTVDCAGDVYLATSDGVHVYGADGTPLGAVNVGSEVTDVAIGGSDHRTLYLTTRGALLALQLLISG